MILLTLIHMILCFFPKYKKVTFITGFIIITYWLQIGRFRISLVQTIIDFFCALLIGTITIFALYYLINAISKYPSHITKNIVTLQLTINDIIAIFIEELIWRGAIQYIIVRYFNEPAIPFTLIIILLINITFVSIHKVHTVTQYIEMSIFFITAALIGYFRTIFWPIGMHIARNNFIKNIIGSDVQ